MKHLKHILLIHGPNLNLLGKRDVVHYGTFTLKKLEGMVKVFARQFGFSVKCFQSNHEGEMIDFLQQHAVRGGGVIINPGALAHYSYALHDALLDTGLPCAEVHLSDVKRREPWRKISVTALACIGFFSGKKEKSYFEAVEFLVSQLSE